MSVLSTSSKSRRANQVFELTSGSLQQLQAGTGSADSVEPPAPVTYAAAESWSVADRFYRRLVQRYFKSTVAGVELVDGFEKETGSRPALRIHSPAFFRRALLGGSLGAAESYLRGEWSSDDLLELLRTFARNMDAVGQADHWFARLLKPRLGHNDRTGSRRHIAAHYDLSNAFFSLMLDPTMTYSAGFFADSSISMEEASLAKYDRICRKLQLSPNDHVLEVGTGWGGFAVYAAEKFGCRVTTTTISQRQYDFTQERLRQAGLTEQVKLLLEDYRDLQGRFDKLVSIEMIEAVGERFLDTYFECCSNLLKSDGMMLLQAITLPDHRHDRYRRSVDFIQRYIFPGGFLPSFSAIGNSLRRRTDFRLLHSEDFGPDYAETLARWRGKFWSNVDQVRQLGFDERFIRMWHYYLCYCEAGFRERQVGVSQLLLTKPACRRDRYCEPNEP